MRSNITIIIVGAIMLVVGFLVGRGPTNQEGSFVPGFSYGTREAQSNTPPEQPTGGAQETTLIGALERITGNTLILNGSVVESTGTRLKPEKKTIILGRTPRIFLVSRITQGSPEKVLLDVSNVVANEIWDSPHLSTLRSSVSEISASELAAGDLAVVVAQKDAQEEEQVEAQYVLIYKNSE
jgi:hypothetical protein